MKNKLINFFKKNWKKILTFFVVFALALLFIIFLINLNKNMNTKTITNEKLYQYLDDQKVNYNGKITLSKDKDKVKLDLGEKNIILDSSPLYYENKDMLIFPCMMSVIFPMNNVSQYKIPEFTTLDSASKTYIQLKYGTKEYDLDKAFLFDGNDLYLFIERTNLNIDGNIITLNPLSFVSYNNLTGYATYYNYKGEAKRVSVKNSIYAYTDKYNVDLKIDGVKYKDDYRLLIKKIDILKNLF